MSVITMLTDFGTEDEYVGEMKGVVLSVEPAAVIVDISHAVDAQNLLQAAFMIDAAWTYFPKETVHLVVIDPGVGGARAIVAVRKKGHRFVAPDNGVLTRLLEAGDVEEAVRVENPEFFRHPVSDTFHGRDIFAPVAAHLCAGVAMNDLGPIVDPRQLVRLSIPEPRAVGENELNGVVLTVDRFGNLITNIDQRILAPLLDRTGGKTPEIRIGGKRLHGIHRRYQQVPTGEPLALIGSRCTLEIAVNCGSAAAYFHAASGDSVQVRLPENRR